MKLEDALDPEGDFILPDLWATIVDDLDLVFAAEQEDGTELVDEAGWRCRKETYDFPYRDGEAPYACAYYPGDGGVVQLTWDHGWEKPDLMYLLSEVVDRLEKG